LAGGTGSGLTCALIEAIRELYPKNYIVTTSVWPRSMGETCLQYYNTCLSIPKIQENADAVLLYENDKIANILNKYPKAILSQLFTMSHINEYIGLGVQQALAPTAESTFDFMSLMDLACCPMFKFLECDIWPFTYEHKAMTGSEEQWLDIFEKCTNSVLIPRQSKTGFSYTKSDIKHKSIAIRAQLKGLNVNKELYMNNGMLYGKIKGMVDMPYKMVDWNPDGLYLKTYNMRPFNSLVVCVEYEL